LVENMIAGTVTGLRVGVTSHPAHGVVLTIAAGGTMTELLDDRASLLVPVAREHVTTALNSLNMAPLMHGYRGKPSINFEALLDAIDALQSYVLANADSLEEVEINPLICTAQAAIAADALIRKTQ
jgi:succinyl-CoA synthetase beta subunit